MFRAVMAGMARAAMFVGRAAGQAADRLVPQGASEMANTLNAGHAYHPVAPYAPPLQRSTMPVARQAQPQRGMEMER